jgi:D-alanine-D-alanine ligase
MTTSVGVFFGGRSVEHEVSVITAQQVMAALPAEFDAVPVYVAKSGAWYTGSGLRELERFKTLDRLLADSTRVRMSADPETRGALLDAGGRRGVLGGGDRVAARIDIALPLVHGTHGEDGTLQGMFELADLAYAGCGVAAAAVSMDKRLTKAVLRSAGLAVLDDAVVERASWRGDRATVITSIESRFAYPLYVKPLSLGSSIGVSRVETQQQLSDAIDLALSYDTRCLAEPAQDGIIEINCAVLGRGGDLRVSACEQPTAGGLLSYADKYLGKGGGKDTAATGMKGAQRLVPAPIAESLTGRIQDAAATAFTAIGAEGVARVDFLVRPDAGEIIVNELNTVPGSLSFYLWEPVGMPFVELLRRLIELGLSRHDEKARTTYSIDTWLLQGRPPG